LRASAVLTGAKVARKKERTLDRTQAWALAFAERLGHNKAAVALALANKTARRLWAAQHHGAAFDPDHRSERPQR
jgi:transposase